MKARVGGGAALVASEPPPTRTFDRSLLSNMTCDLGYRGRSTAYFPGYLVPSTENERI
jgi:hypothetical protein